MAGLCLTIHQTTSTSFFVLFLQIKKPLLCHGISYTHKDFEHTHPACTDIFLKSIRRRKEIVRLTMSWAQLLLLACKYHL